MSASEAATIVEFSAADVRPASRAVLARQGIGPADEPGARIDRLVETALNDLETHAAPRGIFCALAGDEFHDIYRGTGRNAPRTPLEAIFPRAERLALFVVTLGPEITRRIDDLLAAHEFALASVLDAAASEATERAERALERHWLAALRRDGRASEAARALTYSPGYCGWHVSGQRAIFARLRPEAIGVTLRESFLMEPLKSISGVLVAGPAGIHAFADDYPFCADCRTRSCRERWSRAARI